MSRSGRVTAHANIRLHSLMTNCRGVNPFPLASPEALIIYILFDADPVNPFARVALKIQRILICYYPD